jgi:hypothetical protein
MVGGNVLAQETTRLFIEKGKPSVRVGRKAADQGKP